MTDRFHQEFTPNQHLREWQMFLTLCDAHFARLGVTRPIVVELGVLSQKQRLYYESLWNAEYIGIDIRPKTKPDILGDTNDKETLRQLNEKLNGRTIDLLFIDANHDYQFVSRDWAWYGPLCRHIVAMHDITNCDGSRQLWNELVKDTTQPKDSVFISIRNSRADVPVMGIGVIIKGVER